MIIKKSAKENINYKYRLGGCSLFHSSDLIQRIRIITNLPIDFIDCCDFRNKHKKNNYNNNINDNVIHEQYKTEIVSKQ